VLVEDIDAHKWSATDEELSKWENSDSLSEVSRLALTRGGDVLSSPADCQVLRARPTLRPRVGWDPGRLRVEAVGLFVARRRDVGR
jgi:hypothetical protein